MSIKKKEIIINFGLNLIASTIPVMALQLIIYPYLSRKMSGDNYGLMLTFYSILMLVVNSSSNAVGDLRLLYNKDYKENNLKGDFPVLMRRFIVVSTFAMIIASAYCYDKFNIINVLLIIFTSVVVYLNSYLHIELVLNLQYRKICINSFFMVAGYFIGVAITRLISYWEPVYLMPYLCSTIYLLFNTTLIHEPYIKTKNYRRMRKESLLLFATSLIANSTSYADKIVLFPLIGGTSVAIYYTATFLGKAISLVVAPVNRLVLGYIAGMDRISNKRFIKIIGITSAMALIGYIACMLITKPLMYLLYPQWLEEILKYAPVTTATAIITSMASIIQPFLLRYTPIKWQTILQASSALVYFFVALSLLKVWGLMGFCIGGAIGSIFKMVFMVVIYCNYKRDDIKV